MFCWRPGVSDGGRKVLLKVWSLCWRPGNFHYSVREAGLKTRRQEFTLKAEYYSGDMDVFFFEVLS